MTSKQRPKCTFIGCNNPVMKGPETGRLLSVCQECFDRGRMFETMTRPKSGPKGEGRWQVLNEVSPSGKTMFRCLICLRVSPTPDKECPTMDCSGIEDRIFNAPRDLSFDHNDPRICIRCKYNFMASFEEPCHECLKQDGRGFSKFERAGTLDPDW